MITITGKSHVSPGMKDMAPPDNSSFMTREEAIEKLEAVADRGFGADMHYRTGLAMNQSMYVVLWKNGARGHGFAAPPFLMAMLLDRYDLAEKILDRTPFPPLVSPVTPICEFIFDEKKQAYGSIREVQFGTWLINQSAIPDSVFEKLMERGPREGNTPIARALPLHVIPLNGPMVSELPGDPLPESMRRDLEKYPGFTFEPTHEIKKMAMDRYCLIRKRFFGGNSMNRDYYLRSFSIWSNSLRHIPEPDIRLRLMKEDMNDPELLRIWVDILRRDILMVMRDSSPFLMDPESRAELPSPDDLFLQLRKVKPILEKSSLEKGEADALFTFLCVTFLAESSPGGKLAGPPSRLDSAVIKLLDQKDMDMEDVTDRMMRILFCVGDYSERSFNNRLIGAELTESEAYKCLTVFRKFVHRKRVKNGIIVNIDKDWYRSVCRHAATKRYLEPPKKLTVGANDDFCEHICISLRERMEMLLHFADSFTVDPKCRKAGKQIIFQQILLYLDREDLFREAFEKGLLSINDVRAMKDAVLAQEGISNLTPYMIFLTQKGA